MFAPTTTLHRPHARTFAPRQVASRLAGVVLSALFVGGCAVQSVGGAAAAPNAGSHVQVLAPRCAASGAALVGSVVDRDGGEPVGLAAVFIDGREGASAPPIGAGSAAVPGSDPPASASKDASPSAPTVLVTRTDEQGVFTLCDPPSGRYRVAVYARDRRVEVRGVQLGQPGVTLVRVALGSSSVAGS
jgi:hypothetical protein